MTAEELISGGYYQVSRKFGMLAKLPEGKTGREALYEATMRQYAGLPNEAHFDRTTRRWVNGMSEASAADQYLRVYAVAVTVNPTTMRRFRTLGGRTVQ